MKTKQKKPKTTWVKLSEAQWNRLMPGDVIATLYGDREVVRKATTDHIYTDKRDINDIRLVRGWYVLKSKSL